MGFKSSKLQSSLYLLAFMLLSNGSVYANSASPVRGVVKSSGEAVLTVDHNAKVMEIPVQAGEPFKQNDVLMAFDCEALEADRTAMDASYYAAKSVHANNLELQEQGAIGEIEVDVSEAQMKEARARSRAMKARTKNCVIKAPYNGRVADLLINQFETPSENQPLLKIVGSDDLELRLIVPSLWLSWLEVGNEFEFLVDETAMKYRASVMRIGAEVDAVSRTISITAGFQEHPAKVLPGMSGTAYFNDNSKTVSSLDN